jgi:two-component system, OmpR family, response regulator MprA
VGEPPWSTGSGSRDRVLVVDDDPPLRRMLARTLSAEGYDVSVAADGGTALIEAERSAPDVIVLDVAMPVLDGLAVCRRLRGKGLPTPILMLTARDAVPDRVAGLEAGADDYLVKPFAVQELIARLRALTRRGADAVTGGLRSYGDLTFDSASRRATRGGRAIELTGREAALLELLLRETGRVIARDRAIEEIWDGAAEPNVVDRYVTRLRRKLGAPPLIKTVRGSGFTLRA